MSMRVHLNCPMAMPSFHDLWDHMHKECTKHYATSHTVAVGHDQPGPPDSLLDQKWQIAKDDRDGQQSGRADELSAKERDTGEVEHLGLF